MNKREDEGQHLVPSLVTERIYESRYSQKQLLLNVYPIKTSPLRTGKVREWTCTCIALLLGDKKACSTTKGCFLWIQTNIFWGTFWELKCMFESTKDIHSKVWITNIQVKGTPTKIYLCNQQIYSLERLQVGKQ